MHELSIAQSICESVRSHLPDGRRALSVTVECGALSGVVPEALETVFDFAAQAAELPDLALELKRLEARARCPACGHAFSADSMWVVCPECEHGPVTFDGGRELKIMEIEIE
jgi:hydrogenase nickel incorporation protein HypA/HybF